jgi:hypothetical protein
VRARLEDARLGHTGTGTAPLMRSRGTAALFFVVACKSPSPSGASPSATVSATNETTASSESAPAPAHGAAPAAAIVNACNAPSVHLLTAPDDARDFARLAGCNPYEPFFATWDAEEPTASTCGRSTQKRRADVAKMLEAVPPLDDATAAHVRTIVQAGRARGRRPNVVGLVGDSITIDHSFLRPFAVGSTLKVALSPDVLSALALDDAHTIIDLFRGTAGGDDSYDSFLAPRAAKVGARIPWALQYNASMHATPVEDLVSSISPAYAVVMYGTNDAEWYLLSPAALAKEFGDALRSLVDAIESRGVVPILTTIPKHARSGRFSDCPDAKGGGSNLRFAIQTNIVSATIAAVACERALPLIDFRYAIDPLLDHGVGGDGVHPTLYHYGAGVLDDDGLECGYNVRNFVTLRMLKLVREVAIAP